MQIKKEEVKQKILKNAEDEFYQFGYEKTSVRRIVKTSGTTIGNFYNCFENKESLFEEVVRSEYLKFKYFITNHDQSGRIELMTDLSDSIKCRKILTEVLPTFMPGFTKRFVILIECSQGTRYENTRNQLLDLITEHFEEHVHNFCPEYRPIELSSVLAQQLLSGMVLIIRSYKDDEVKRSEMMVEYLLFYFTGTMGMLGAAFL